MATLSATNDTIVPARWSNPPVVPTANQGVKLMVMKDVDIPQPEWNTLDMEVDPAVVDEVAREVDASSQSDTEVEVRRSTSTWARPQAPAQRPKHQPSSFDDIFEDARNVYPEKIYPTSLSKPQVFS